MFFLIYIVHIVVLGISSLYIYKKYDDKKNNFKDGNSCVIVRPVFFSNRRKNTARAQYALCNGVPWNKRKKVALF